MKRARIVLYLLVFLLATALTGCQNPSVQTEKQNPSTPLEEAMRDYTQMVEGILPQDLRLTIYFLDPSILTRAPLSTDGLVTFPGVKTIIVDSKELEGHMALLRELDASILQPVEELSYINARLYYVFEIGDSEKILEVVINEIHGSVFVNGIEVEDNPVFYELILPFLTEEDGEILGIEQHSEK